MSGIRGDDDEHPANKRAGKSVSAYQPCFTVENLQSNMIAIAINIMSTW